MEDLAASGVRQLEVGSGVALTDAARELAEELGIKLVVAGSAPASSAASKVAAPAPAAPAKSGALPARPRGCQHGPLGGAAGPASSTAPAQVVEQLVDAVSALKMSALKKRGG